MAGNSINTIANRIKKVRNGLNYSVNKMGLVTGYAANYIREVEAGRSVPSDEFISLISKLFSVDKTWLKTGKGDATVPRPPIDYIAVAHRFQQLRLENNLAQTQVAEYSGVSQGFISIIEKSIVTGTAVNISDRQIKKMAEAFSVGFDWLAYGNEDAKEFPCDDAMISFLNSNPELRKYISKKMEK